MFWADRAVTMGKRCVLAHTIGALTGPIALRSSTVAVLRSNVALTGRFGFDRLGIALVFGDSDSRMNRVGARSSAAG
jgi:hypothetical protein